MDAHDFLYICIYFLAFRGSDGIQVGISVPNVGDEIVLHFGEENRPIQFAKRDITSIVLGLYDIVNGNILAAEIQTFEVSFWFQIQLATGK